jgi:hypothetical protein
MFFTKRKGLQGRRPSRARHNSSKAHRARPSLELLESRFAPAAAMFTVVPAAGADGVTSFATLAAALGVASSGDVIQVEPGSDPTPGGGSANVTQDNLTIQGDPTASCIGLRASGTEIGTINLQGNNDILTGLFIDKATISFGEKGFGETFTNSIYNGGGITQLSGPGTDGSNTVSGNTFLGKAVIVLGDPFKAAGNATSTNDTVTENDFINFSGVNAISVFSETAGLLISGNRIVGTDPTIAQTGILAQDCVGTVNDNQIHLGNNGNTVGITIQDGDSLSADTSTDLFTNTVTANDNVITTNGGGTGIFVNRTSDKNIFTVSMANNALAGSFVGLFVSGDIDGAGNDYGDVSAGGTTGAASSTGGNDFRGYTGTGGNFAIVAVDASSTSSFLAQSNLFSVADPNTVVDTSQASGTFVDVSNPLSGGGADLIARFDTAGQAAPTTSQQSSESSADALTQAHAAIANTPAATAFVDGLYESLLGRLPGSGEDQGWVNGLSGGTMTEEMVILGFLNGPEYFAKVTQGSSSPNATWVQSLYLNLLGRQCSTAELNGWMNVITNEGIGVVAQRFVSSNEFRGNVIGAMYGLAPIGVIPQADILKRSTAPDPNEVVQWKIMALDLLSVEARILASSEFGATG